MSKKYCTAGQDTDDNIIRRIRFAFCIPMATDTHSEYVIPIAFHSNNGYVVRLNVPFKRTLPALVSWDGVKSGSFTTVAANGRVVSAPNGNT
jgi:hypothetical protein